MKGAAHFILPGLCEFEEMSFVMHFLRADDLFVDVGANIGAYTILASGIAGARSISFEPSASSFTYLERNVRLNDLTTKVILVKAALGAEDGHIFITDDLGVENYVHFDANPEKSRKIPLRRMDIVLANERPILIK